MTSGGRECLKRVPLSFSPVLWKMWFPRVPDRFALEDMHEAGKTGTANDYRDLTFAGFTPYYTAAIWAGYDDPQDLPSLTGLFTGPFEKCYEPDP